MDVSGELPTLESASSVRVRVRPVGLFGGLAMLVVWVVMAALIVAAAVVIIPLALVVLLFVAIWRGAGGVLRAMWPRGDGRRNVRVREERP